MEVYGTYAVRLGLTIAVELLVVVALSRLARRPVPLLDVVLLNAISHPVATALFSADVLGFWEAEAGVVVFEAVGYVLLSRLRVGFAVVVSVAANVVTGALSLAF